MREAYRCRLLGCMLFSLAMVVPTQSVWAQASGAANITFQWTDRGGTAHILKSGWVVGVEDDGILGTEPAGQGFTSPFSGIFVLTGSDLTLFDSQTEFKGTINGYIGSGMTANAQIANTGGAVYSQAFPNEGALNVPDPPGFANFNYTVDNTTYAGTAIGMLQAVKFMQDYYASKGLTTPYLNIVYDSTVEGSAYSDGTTTIEFDANDWASWDVIFHETGHYIARKNNLDAGTGFGGDHNFGQDLIGVAGIATGVRRSWNEGLATHLGLMAVKDGNLAAAIPGLPGIDTDAFYDAFNTPLNASTQNDNTNVSYRISAENLTPITGADGQNLGEADEMSILRVLWDVFDADADAFAVGSDKANFGADGILGILSGADMFEDFWDNLVTTSLGDPTKLGLAVDATQYEVLGSLGEILQEYQIGHAPVDAIKVDSTPTLKFIEQNNDRATRNRFVILDENLQFIVDELDFADTVGINTWTWDVLNPLAPGNYYFAALGNSAIDLGASPLTDQEWYWSSLDKFEVVPEASTVVMSALVTLAAGIGVVRRKRA